METKWAGADRGRYDVTYDTETSAPHRGLKASVQQWADSGGVLWQSGVTSFTCNNRRELTGSDFNVGTSKDFTFAYDLMGKRQSKVQNGSATTYAAAGADQNPIVQTHDVNEYASITGAHAESGLAYDDNGNMAQDGAWHYEYDADEAREREDGESAGFDLAAARSEEAGALRATTKQNRLTKMTRKSPSSDPTVADRLEFQYDYLSRRTRKTAFDATSGGGELSDTVFVWSGWNLVSELNANDSLAQTRSYLWGQGYAPGGAGALLAVKVGTAVYYPVYDPTGNVTGYLNASGTAVSKYDGARQRGDGQPVWAARRAGRCGSPSGGSVRQYNAYGELTNQGNYTSATFAHGFSTQYTDRETGLVYYGYRYYDPQHGRFINRDPIQEAGGLNLYSFVGNSPANGWDYRGLLQFCWYYHTTRLVAGTGEATRGADGVWNLPSATVESETHQACVEVSTAEAAAGLSAMLLASLDGYRPTGIGYAVGSDGSIVPSDPREKDPCAGKLQITREAISNIKADGRYTHILTAIATRNPEIVVQTGMHEVKEHLTTGQVKTRDLFGDGAYYNSGMNQLVLTTGLIASTNGKFESQIIHEGTHIFDELGGMDLKANRIGTEINAWTNTLLYADQHGGVAMHWPFAVPLMNLDGSINEPLLRSSLSKDTTYGSDRTNWNTTRTPIDPCSFSVGEVSP